MAQPRFRIQKSPDQRLFASFPELIAGYHVFRRLSMPRHPPHTLSSLTTFIDHRHTMKIKCIFVAAPDGYPGLWQGHAMTVADVKNPTARSITDRSPKRCSTIPARERPALLSKRLPFPTELKASVQTEKPMGIQLGRNRGGLFAINLEPHIHLSKSSLVFNFPKAISPRFISTNVPPNAGESIVLSRWTDPSSADVVPKDDFCSSSTCVTDFRSAT